MAPLVLTVWKKQNWNRERNGPDFYCTRLRRENSSRRRSCWWRWRRRRRWWLSPRWLTRRNRGQSNRGEKEVDTFYWLLLISLSRLFCRWHKIFPLSATFLRVKKSEKWSKGQIPHFGYRVFSHDQRFSKSFVEGRNPRWYRLCRCQWLDWVSKLEILFVATSSNPMWKFSDKHKISIFFHSSADFVRGKFLPFEAINLDAKIWRRSRCKRRTKW